MAKKRTIIEENIPDNQSPGTEEPVTDFDVSLESVEDIEALRNVLDQFGSPPCMFKVFRQTSNGSPEYCFQSEAMDEDFIQKNFGGGDYIIRIFINSKYRSTVKIKIAARLQTESQNHHDHHSEFLEKMLLALITNTTQQRQSTPVGEITDALVKVDQLRAGSNSDKSSNMDMFLKGVEFAKDLTNSDEDWKTTLFKTIREVAPGFMQNLPSLQVAQQQKPNPPSQQEQQIQVIREAINSLKPYALRNEDIGLVVDWIIGSLHVEKIAYLYRTAISTEFAVFAQIDPEIGTEPYIGWFKLLYDGLRQSNKTSNSLDDDSEGEAGNYRNPSPNGGVGERR